MKNYKYCINVDVDGTLTCVGFVNTKEEAERFVDKVRDEHYDYETIGTSYMVWDEQNSEWVDCDYPFAK